MLNEESRNDQADESHRQLIRVRLPGWVRDEDVGLGDIIKRATSAIGIRPSGDCGCERRAATLNRWFVFYGQRRR